jgi:putative transposase
MSPSESVQLLRLFQKAAPVSFFEEVCREQEYPFRRGVYSVMVVVWLMIWQRLQSRSSLAAAVQCLLQGPAGVLMDRCKRVEQDKISAATGGYCQARQRLPQRIVIQVSDRIVEQLRREMQEGRPGLGRPIFLIDGSSLLLSHTPELVQRFSPGRNQYGSNHWPVLKLVVFHDVFSGLALRPSWGSMYGPQAVSEQSLAEQALERLPEDAVVLADCNFGIFAFAWAVGQSRRPMIFRLSRPRAQKILGTPLVSGTDRKILWEASDWDQKHHPELPPDATVAGRLLVCENPSRRDDLLYLWTTLNLPAEQILEMYGLRWNIETDLRSLKRTVGLQQLNSKSPEMIEKELLLAVAAYNLVRAVMCLAARRAGIDPRRLSFSFTQTVVEAALPGLDQATTEAEYGQRLERMLRYAAQGKLPKRSRKRSYPRQIWGRSGAFPRRKRVPENTEFAE